MGHPGVNLNDTIKLAETENHNLEPKVTTVDNWSYGSLKNL